MRIEKVVFMGTPEFAVRTLEELIEADRYRVQAVFTQPDRPRGRSRETLMSPVKQTAVKAGIPVFQPEKLRDASCTQELKELRPDVIVVAAYGQMIPKEILDLPPCGCVNVHASLLPKYRGAAPIQWAVIDGEQESGVTTMIVTPELDTGDIILQKKVKLSPDETGGSLSEKLSEAGAALLLETLDQISDGTAQFQPQPKQSPTHYASMLTKQDGRIDWTRSAAAIDCQIRGMDPWPNAWTRFHGRLLKIYRAQVQPEPSGAAQKPGTVLAAGKTSLEIQTGDGVLRVLELQPEGKKRMPADAFLRGYPVKAGEIFAD